RAQLEEAVRQREEVQQELVRTAEELSSLREQGGSDTANLRAQLEEAVRQREEVQQSLRDAHVRLLEADRACKVAVQEKVCGIRVVEEKLLGWKEKVLAAKARDDARIESLEASVIIARDDVRKFVSCLLGILTLVGETVADDVREGGDGEADVFSLLSRVENFELRLKRNLKLLDVKYATLPLVEVLALLTKDVSGARMELDEATAELHCCQQELAEVTANLTEAEGKVASSPPPGLLAELEARNSHLEEKCELLRREIKRQREAFQREKAQESIYSLSAMQEEGGATPRAVAGGVFERDMLLLANQQSQRDNEIRQLRVQLQALEKENADLQRECDHNNSMVAQYTKDIEVLKAKERVKQSVEYVRNVILQFLCCSSEEIRLQMVPAIATVLEFSPKEKLDVQRANPACPRFH
ncbi:putative MYH7B protein, partial [Trypanosoma rangeli]